MLLSRRRTVETPNTARQTNLGPRLVFSGLMVAATWIGEEFPTLADRPWWYQRQVMGVPLQYLLFAGLFVVLSPYIWTKPSIDLSRPLRTTGLWRWSVLSALTVGLGIALGIIRQSPELFVDWRNWVVIIITTVVAARWLATQPWRRYALSDMAIAYGMMSTLSLVNWALGGGTEFYGLRVPIWYGYNLMLAGFAAVVATDVWLNDRGGLKTGYLIALRWTAAACSLVVILSFRRSFWLLLLAGFGMIGWRAVRGRSLRVGQWLRFAIAAILVAGAALISYGADALATRIASLNPGSDNEFSNTNSDHLGDLADAFDVISRDPILGLGIGSNYETVRIANWKTESFEVHNAFLNAWLKFGLLGLITYIGFHYRLVIAFIRTRGSGYVGVVGAGLYMAAEQVPSLIQTWPYNSLQLSIHHGVMLAVLLIVVAEQASRPTRNDLADLGVGLNA